MCFFKKIVWKRTHVINILVIWALVRSFWVMKNVYYIGFRQALRLLQLFYVRFWVPFANVQYVYNIMSLCVTVARRMPVDFSTNLTICRVNLVSPWPSALFKLIIWKQKRKTLDARRFIIRDLTTPYNNIRRTPCTPRYKSTFRPSTVDVTAKFEIQFGFSRISQRTPASENPSFPSRRQSIEFDIHEYFHTRHSARGRVRVRTKHPHPNRNDVKRSSCTLFRRRRVWRGRHVVV